MKTVLERFEEKFIPEPNTGCWLWFGSTYRQGYGQFWFKKRNQPAHRVAYELYKGVTLRNLGLHRCDNVWCVNPDHTFDGSYSDNQQDCIKKNRRGNRKSRSWVLTKLQAETIKQRSQERAVDLADEFSVHVSTIKRIRNKSLVRS